MKLRRLVATTVVVGALALAPASAWAYAPSDYTVTASTLTPPAGQPFTLNVIGQPNSTVTVTFTSALASIPDSAITLAGTRSLTKTTDASGVASFQVTLSQAGTYTATFDTPAGPLPAQTFTVVDAAAPSPSPTASSTPSLSATGSNAAALGLGAVALLALGSGAVVYQRRQANARG